MNRISKIGAAVGFVAALIVTAVVREKPRDDDSYWEAPDKSRARSGV